MLTFALAVGAEYSIPHLKTEQAGVRETPQAEERRSTTGEECRRSAVQ
jgi:hypothetical protein